MTTINIWEFEGYDVDEFIEFLKAENTEDFEIVVPKETTLFFTENAAISLDFAIAAYIGHKLNEISSNFRYVAALVGTPGYFKFTIKCNRICDLGELLSEMSSVFENSEIDSINFSSEVSGFMEEFKGKKVVCQDLFDIAYEYRSDEKEED